MAPMSLFEKMDKLVATMNTTTLIMMLLSIVFISVMFIFSDKNRKYSYMSYLFVLVFVGFTFKESLFRLLDMFVERLFYLFYFPTGAIYMITLVVSHVVFLNSLGNKNKSKLVKNINFVGFSFMQVLCINVLNYLTTSNADLTNELNFVNDKTMISILELSMLVFTLWMGSLIVISVIRKMTNTVLSSELSLEEEKTPVTLEVPVTEVKERTPVLKPLLATITRNMNEKMEALKEYKQERMLKPEVQPIETKVEPLYTKVEEPTLEQPKMTQELLDRLLAPEPMMMEKTVKVAETTTTTVSETKEPVMSWSDAVIDALHIPSDPIYNDVEKPFMNRIVETVPVEKVVEENVSKEEQEVVKTSNNKETSKVVDLCQILLRKQEESGHTLEDYLELKKYLLAEK